MRKYILLLLYLSVYLVLFMMLDDLSYIPYIVSALFFLTLSNYVIFSRRMYHPAIWLHAALLIYGFSGSLLHYSKIIVLSHPDLVAQFGLISLFVIDIYFLFTIKIDDDTQLERLSSKSNSRSYVPNYRLSAVMFYMLFFSEILLNIRFALSGVTSKTQATLEGLYSVSFLHGWFFIFFALIIMLEKYHNNRFPIKRIAATISISLFSTLNYGERDLIFTALFIITFAYSYFHRIGILKLIGFSTFGLTFFTILSQLRTIFAANDSNVSLNQPIWIEILSGEFLSAGRNLDYLISFQDRWEYFNGIMLYKDVISGLVPKQIYSLENSLNWYNKTFFANIVDTGGGVGFTYLGSWYINFGVVGICIGVVVICSIANYFYRLSFKNILGSSLFLVIPGMLVYAIRGDLSVILGAIIRQGILPLFILYIVDIIVSRPIARMKNEWRPQ